VLSIADLTTRQCFLAFWRHCLELTLARRDLGFFLYLCVYPAACVVLKSAIHWRRAQLSSGWSLRLRFESPRVADSTDHTTRKPEYYWRQMILQRRSCTTTELQRFRRRIISKFSFLSIDRKTGSRLLGKFLDLRLLACVGRVFLLLASS
jgi:hypothetical protein